MVKAPQHWVCGTAHVPVGHNYMQHRPAGALRTFVVPPPTIVHDLYTMHRRQNYVQCRPAAIAGGQVANQAHQ